MYLCIRFNWVLRIMNRIIFMQRVFVVMLSFFLVTVAGAQSQRNRNIKEIDKNGKSDLVRVYTDSLAAVKQRIEQKTHLQKDGNLQVQLYRLFLPSTFYHSLAHDMMCLDSIETSNSLYDNEVNNSLLNLYLNHPNLVTNTQSSMDKTGTVEVEITTPIRNEAELITQIEEKSLPIDIIPMNVVVTKPNFWTLKGDYSLQFMQNFISSNWYKGGESTYSMLGAVTMEANYNNKQKVKWDNKLELKLGMQNTRSDSIHRLKTNEDLIRLTSKLGLQATKHWYYTLQVIGQTQFTHSYKSNDPTVYADFMAPGKLNVSLGMDYNVDWMKHKLKGTVHLAPVAYNLNYTRLLELSTRLGIDEGKHALHDFGSQFTVDLTWELGEMLKWKTRLYGYTTYQRAELEWENTFVFQFNKWLAAQLFVYPRFDDSVVRNDHHGYWQFKEFASVGFNYSF